MSDGDYTGRIMEIYDLLYPLPDADLDALDATLRDLAPGVRVMEYGIGNGRVAVPLRDRGFEMSGIDISSEMLAQLAARDPSGLIAGERASFTSPGRRGEHDAVLVMINTAFFAYGLDEQIALFSNAASELRPGGILALEVFNPLLFPAGVRPRVEMRQLDPSTILLEQFTVDPVHQLLIAQNTVLGRGAPIMWTQLLRYMYPSEMDAVARGAGFTLVRRTSDWESMPYRADSPRCVSVYRTG